MDDWPTMQGWKVKFNTIPCGYLTLSWQLSKLMVRKSLSFDAMDPLTKSVQNFIQYQTSVNATAGSNNRNDRVVEQFASGDRATQQSLREGTLLTTPSFTASSRRLEHEATAIVHSASDALSPTQQHQNASMSSRIRNSENNSEGNNNAEPNDQPAASFCDSYAEQEYGLEEVEALSRPSQDLQISTRQSQTGDNHTIVNGSHEEPSQSMGIQSEPDRSQHEIPFNDTVSCFNPDQNMDENEYLNIQRGYLQHTQSLHPVAYYPHSTEEPLHSFAPDSILNNTLPTEIYPHEEPPTELYSFGEAPTELYHLEEHPTELYSLDEEPTDLYNFGILTETVYGSSHLEPDPSAFSGST